MSSIDVISQHLGPALLVVFRISGLAVFGPVQPLALGLSSFKYLLIYFAVSATLGIAFTLMQRRQAAVIRGMNRELGEANEFLLTENAALLAKTSRISIR